MHSTLRHLSFVSFLFASQQLSSSPEKPNFEDDLLPLFEESCNSCHNPDKAKGGLDLTSMNGILAGGSSGDAALPGDSQNSLIYLLAARLEEPYMPPKGDKLAKAKLDLIKVWIDKGLLPTASGKPMIKKKSSVNLALGSVSQGKPEGPPPMPEHLPLEPSVVAERAFAPSAMATAPWSPLVAISGQKQVLLYHTETLQLLGILPYPEGFIESLQFSRNGKIVLASGGRGGKSGKVAGWNLKSGKRILTVGAEYDSILTADLSADQSLIALGGPSKLVKVLDLASGDALYQIKKHSEWVTQVQFSPDGILLATGDRNGGLHVWEAQTGNPFYTLDGHKEAITDLSWRADSNVLLSSSEEGRVMLWEMNDGKQIKNWNAHTGGTLSAHYDSKGKIVTGGRDKTVKYWDGDGKALQTLSGFSDIVMESRLSHDGSRIIAGDWSGEVTVWQSSDGKKIGVLGANPPKLSNRLVQAQNILEDRRKAMSAAQAKYDPLAQAEKQAVTKEVQSASKAKQAAATLARASSAMQNAQENLLKAQGEEKAKVLEKATRQKDRDLKGQALSQAKQNHLSHSGSHEKWKKRTNFRAEQVSALHEGHRKFEEVAGSNADDSSYKEALAKQKEALTAMEKAFAKARDTSAVHKAEMEKFANLIGSTTLALEKATQDLQAADKALSDARSKALASDKSHKESVSKHAKANDAKTQADTVLKADQKTLAQAREALKAPAAELDQAKTNFSQADRNVARWKAELINLERHAELAKLQGLESELSGLKEILAEAESLKNSALQAAQTATETLRLVPQRIADAEKLVLDRQSKVKGLEAGKKAILEAKIKKTEYINEVGRLASVTQKNSLAKEADSILSQANAKFEETIGLLKQDLAKTESLIEAKQLEVADAETSVAAARKSVEEAVKLKESAPKVLAEKQKNLTDATKKLEEKKTSFQEFKVSVDKQVAISEALLTRYLDALPK